MPTISLTTDFGLEDNFVGVIKAVISSINPKVNVIDICHNVRSQGVREGAFLLKGAFKYFPRKTIHLAIVDPAVGSNRKKLLVETKNYFFIAPDNGLLSLALKEEPPFKIVEITNEKYFLKPVSDTFHGRDIFASVAAHLSKGKRPGEFGREIKKYNTIELPRLKRKPKELLGEVVYFDRFGNAVTNIDASTFSNFIKGRKFNICVRDKEINKLSRSYAGGGRQAPLALMGSFGYLEIAVNCGLAKRYLRLKEGTGVRVTLK